MSEYHGPLKSCSRKSLANKREKTAEILGKSVGKWKVYKVFGRHWHGKWHLRQEQRGLPDLRGLSWAKRGGMQRLAWVAVAQACVT
jgi:hypothetical protein